MASFLATGKIKVALSAVASILFCLLLIRIDLGTKEVIFKYLPISENGQRIEGLVREVIVPGFALVNVQNTGIAWGKLQNLGNSTQILTVTGVMLELILLISFFFARSKLQKISILLIFSGGFGNIYDRIKMGYVRDFVDLYIGDHHWPAFNMADSFVAIGACMLIIADIVATTRVRRSAEQSEGKGPSSWGAITAKLAKRQRKGAKDQSNGQ